MKEVKCPTCGSGTYTEGYVMSTLVGYSKWTENGVLHEHNDNCRKSEAQCEKGHTFVIRYQGFCPNCDWVGKTSCFCDSDAPHIVVCLKEHVEDPIDFYDPKDNGNQGA
jgi:hypothetical protein